MIAKGNPHNNGPRLARYLVADSTGNERAELRGFATDNIYDAFALGQLLAEGTQAVNPFFHVQVRTPQGEILTRAQWQHVAERIERHLRFDGQPRAIVFHRKNGQEHMHLVWSRINTDTMRAIDPGLYKRKLKEVCRALEKEMGLKQIKNERGPKEKTQPAARPEYEQSRRLKTDLKAIRESIRDCWDKSGNGRDFIAALERQGFLLARGDRRALVIVDEAGGYHALSKRIIGVTARETKARLADIDAASLPSVDQAKALQREKRHGEEFKGMDDDRLMTEEERRQEAIRNEEENRQEEEKKQKAIADEEGQRAQFREQADRQAEQAREMERQQKKLEDYKAELARLAEEAEREEEARRRAASEGSTQELAIRDSKNRYGQALAQHYDIRDPYGSLARSAMAEYGAFLRDREALDRRIAEATDPNERRSLELQKRIESAEYMAITSRRIASQSIVINGKMNPETRRLETQESVKQTARAEAFEKEASALREEYREVQTARAQETEKQPRRNEPQRAAEPKSQPEKEAGARRERDGALMVEERMRGKEGKPERLTDFVNAIPCAPESQERDLADSRKTDDRQARANRYAKLAAEQQRSTALRRISGDLEARRALNASDVRYLSREDLEKIREKGDDALRQIVQEHTRQRSQARER